MRFDMRALSFGAPAAALYSAAADMCAWAATRGCIAAAIAARTQRLPLNITVILPFYDPVRLAEDLCLLDIISGGRVSVTFGIGYRPEEYQHFGLNIRRRGRLADEKLDLLRKLLSDAHVVHDGRHIAVTPRPHTTGGPTLMWGGASLAA